MNWNILYSAFFINLLIATLDVKVFAEEGKAATAAAVEKTEANASGSAAADKDDDGAGKALEVEETIESSLTEIESAFKEANSGDTVAQAPGHTAMVDFAKQYLNNKTKCVNFHQGAAYACLEFLSSHMIDGAAALSAVSALGGLAIKDTCSKFSNAMDIASKALTAYTAACGAAKLGCGGFCGSALEGVQGIIKTNAKLICKPTVLPPNPAYAAAKAHCDQLEASYSASIKTLKEESQSEFNKSNKISVAGKDALCTEKYAQLAISAVAGIASLAKSIMQGKNCEKNTAADLTKLAAVQPTVEQCADPKNASLPDCICLKNPRTPGCGNTFQKPGDSSISRLAASATGPGGSASNSKGGLGNLDGTSGLPPVDTSNFNGSGDGGGGAGAPMGGGSAGLSGGGSGGGGGNGAGANGSGGGGLDLSKYGSGFAGGGGGAGRYGGGSASGSGSGKYGAYLPGGAKDPTRGLAGQQAWTNEVTGQGGKSNWEKVKERYHDNKGSLINNSN
ncbi:MAG: hypothetical protein ACXVCA_07340 [Bdellovibrio sp.]